MKFNLRTEKKCFPNFIFQSQGKSKLDNESPRDSCSSSRLNKQLKSHSIFFIALLVATNNSNYPKRRKISRPSHSTFQNKYELPETLQRSRKRIRTKSIQTSIKLAQKLIENVLLFIRSFNRKEIAALNFELRSEVAHA